MSIKPRRNWQATPLAMTGIAVLAILLLSLTSCSGAPAPNRAGPIQEKPVGPAPEPPPPQVASRSPASSTEPAMPPEEPAPNEPSHANSPTAKPGHERSASSPDIAGTQIQDEYQDAVERAKNGKIDYQVPSPMRVGDAQTVSVRIYGSNTSEQQQEAFPSTGKGTLKVVTSMVVALTEPDNPSAFEIKPADDIHQGIQFVSADGYAEWDWVVTPLEGGTEPLKLRITADMVFNAELPNGTPMRTEISSYNAAVQVRVKPRLEAFADWWSENWKDILKYLVPTGGGSLLVIWLLSRGGKKSEKPRPEQEKSSTPNTSTPNKGSDETEDGEDD
jgi:hypothetical protein